MGQVRRGDCHIPWSPSNTNKRPTKHNQETHCADISNILYTECRKIILAFWVKRGTVLRAAGTWDARSPGLWPAEALALSRGRSLYPVQ